MDGINWKERVTSFLRQYKYVVLVVAIGLVLMSLPARGEGEQQPPANVPVPVSPDIQTQLEEILSQIQGVGKVRVLVTQDSGELTLYQADEDASGTLDNSSSRSQTVLVTGSDREEEGLIRQVIPPKYRGAMIVCQGGDQPAVRLAVVEAVEDVTGLSSDKITVLKMK